MAVAKKREKNCRVVSLGLLTVLIFFLNSDQKTSKMVSGPKITYPILRKRELIPADLESGFKNEKMEMKSWINNTRPCKQI